MQVIGIEFIEYLFGGLLYLVSPRFRAKKNHKWSNQSNMYKIYEIGMWVTIPIICALLIIVTVAI